MEALVPMSLPNHVKAVSYTVAYMGFRTFITHKDKGGQSIILPSATKWQGPVLYN